MGFEAKINFNTRANTKLDLIMTDIAEYKSAIEVAPIANNDHCTILLKRCPASTSSYVSLKRRLITTELSVLLDLAKAEWQDVLSLNNIHRIVEALHKTINDILNKHCPFVTIKKREDKLPWMSILLVKIVKARDKVYRKSSPTYEVLRAFAQCKTFTNKREFTNNQLYNKQNTRQW